MNPDGITGTSSPNVRWHPGLVDRDQRSQVTGGPGVTVWLTGLSGSGKSTVAHLVEQRLAEAGRVAYVLDGDNLRHGLNADLGFSADDRNENVRRTAEVARLFADAGVVVLVALISPYRAARDHARQLHVDAGLAFVEAWVDTPVDECRRRDPKGLYAKADGGELSGFTAVGDPYEPPEAPELHLTGTDGPEVLADLVVAALPRS